MKKIILITSITMMQAFASAQTFPTITGETLQDKSITLPDYVKGKQAVIGIAMSMKAEDALKKWADPLYNTLVSGSMGGLMGANMYNANLCFVGMLRGATKLAYGEVKKQAKKNVDSKLHGYYVISDDDAGALVEQLKIKDKAEPVFVVIDEQGKILKIVKGNYTPQKMDEITDALLQ
jgi:hypothetical protein